MTRKTLYIVRHCKATGQQADASLTPEGEEQASMLAHFLADAKIERIVSSPFARAIQSIEPLAQRLGLEIETDARLIERVLGSGALADWRTSLQETFVDLDLRFEGGESSRAAMQRAVAAVQDILQHNCQTTAIVSHGNLSTLLLRHFDDRIGFATWEAMTTPDVFRVVIAESGATVERVWQSRVEHGKVGW